MCFSVFAALSQAEEMAQKKTRVVTDRKTVARNFFNLPTITLAQELIGTYLAHESPQGLTIGRIVETEAYLYHGDPACHAAKGETKRNQVMFGSAGHCYVYLIYGIYFCFNVVSGAEGEGEAVLIRALEPVHGIELMQKRRRTEKMNALCSGPGKLVLAMGINADHNGQPINNGGLRIYRRDGIPEIIRTTRIGISQGSELPLRFYLKDSPFVSKK